MYNIIYIDDNEFDHYTLDNLAKSTIECNVKCFLNGKEALKFLDDRKKDVSQTPDIIFLDLYMPEFTGWDFLKAFDKVKNDYLKLPMVYILSSFNDDDSISRSTNYSFVNRYLSKPLTEDIFHEISNYNRP